MLRVWVRVIGAAAARRALPMWAGVGVVASIIFGGTGMQPSDLTGMARGDARVAIAIGLMWIVLVAPVGVAIAEPRATAWLRALPSARAMRWLVVGSVAAIAQAPWGVLWLEGEGPIAGALAVLLGAAATLIVGRARWPLPARAPRWRGAVRAIAGVHARALVRTRGAAIARAIAWAMCGGATAGLVAHANEIDALVPILIAVAIAAPLGLAGLAGPVAESDRAIAWTALAASPGARAAAQAIALGAIGALIGALVAGVAMLVGGAPIVAIAAAGGLGAGLGAASARVGAWALAGADVDGTRVVIGMVIAAMASALAVGALGAWAIAGAAAAGVALVAPMASPRSLA